MEHKRTRLPNRGDRISALPEPIIHHILSFLPPEDVKVTSSLSKTWYYHISTSFPFLDFDFDDSPFNRYFKPNKYLNYIDQTLHRFHNHNDLTLHIQRLNLKVPFTPSLPELLDSWISIVLQHEIQELNLDIRNSRGDHNHRPCYYNLPSPVFAAKSIKVAKLGECSLLQSFPCGSGSTLLKLHLDHVLLDDQILSSIISTCPLIEDLAILSCIGIKRFRISNLSKLKSLRISHGSAKEETIEIDAPSLQSLDIHGSVKLQVLKCPKLMDLDLNKVEFEEFGLQDFLLNLSYLRSLSLANLSSLTRFQISSDTLNKLKFLGCDRLVELKIDAPNLGSLECNIDSYILTSMHEVTCLWNSNDVKNPVTLEDFLVVVRNFVSKARYLKTMKLFLNFQPINFNKLNKRAVQAVVNIDHLTLCVVVNSFLEISYLDIFDCVLWSCHPRTLSLRFPCKDLVMSIYEVMGHRHRPCNLSGCWIHCLEEVKYVNRDRSKGRLPMDGVSLRSFRVSYREIQLIFKW